MLQKRVLPNKTHVPARFKRRLITLHSRTCDDSCCRITGCREIRAARILYAEKMERAKLTRRQRGSSYLKELRIDSYKECKRGSVATTRVSAAEKKTALTRARKKLVVAPWRKDRMQWMRIGRSALKQIRSIFDEMFYDPKNVTFCGLGPQTGGTVLESIPDGNALSKKVIRINRDTLESLFWASSAFWTSNPGAFFPLAPIGANQSETVLVDWLATRLSLKLGRASDGSNDAASFDATLAALGSVRSLGDVGYDAHGIVMKATYESIKDSRVIRIYGHETSTGVAYKTYAYDACKQLNLYREVRKVLIQRTHLWTCYHPECAANFTGA